MSKKFLMKKEKYLLENQKSLNKSERSAESICDVN